MCHHHDDTALCVDVKQFIVASPDFAHAEVYGVLLVKHNILNMTFLQLCMLGTGSKLMSVRPISDKHTEKRLCDQFIITATVGFFPEGNNLERNHYVIYHDFPECCRLFSQMNCFFVFFVFYFSATLFYRY